MIKDKTWNKRFARKYVTLRQHQLHWRLKNNHKTKELELEKKVKDILYPEAHRRNREDFKVVLMLEKGWDQVSAMMTPSLGIHEVVCNFLEQELKMDNSTGERVRTLFSFVNQKSTAIAFSAFLCFAINIMSKWQQCIIWWHSSGTSQPWLEMTEKV